MFHDFRLHAQAVVGGAEANEGAVRRDGFARSGFLELGPENPLVNLMLGVVYLQQSIPTRAVRQLERAATMAGRTAAVVAQLGHAYGVAGQKAEAQACLDELAQRSKREYVAAYWIAMLNHGLGREDAALASLEKAFRDREALLVLDVEPRWDGLRGDPRFQDLQRRVGFSAPNAQ